MDEQDKKHLDSLLRHIEHVKQAALLLGMRLIENEIETPVFGRLLIANSFIHDNSKFYETEWSYLRDEAPKELREIAIKQHVSTNQHHPEYWGGFDGMPKVYIAEFVCDTHARSVEFGTDLREWITSTAFKRYKIPPNGKSAKTIKTYLNILLDKPFKS